MNPVPLLTRVNAPTPSATAITAKPMATIDRAVASGSATCPAGALARALQPGPADHADQHAADQGQRASPLPSASVPRTSWKYCGIANKMPNIANDTSVARIVPQANPAERNSDSSISGRTRPTAEPPLASLRRVSRYSQATSPASTTAPAAIVASAVGSVQPSWPAG